MKESIDQFVIEEDPLDLEENAKQPQPPAQAFNSQTVGQKQEIWVR